MMIGDTTVGKTSLLVRYADDDFNESVLATIGIDFKIKVGCCATCWLCCLASACCPFPAAHPCPPPSRRRSTSTARRSSCRFGTLPARCVAPVHHPRARSERRPERGGPRLCVRVADLDSVTARQERFRTITQAYYRGAMGILLIYVRRPPSNLDAPALWLQPSAPPVAGCDQHQDVEQYSQLGSQHRGQRATDREQDPRRQQASGTSILRWRCCWPRLPTGWLRLPPVMRPSHAAPSLPAPTLAERARRCDMASMRQVTSAQGEQLARECALPPLPRIVATALQQPRHTPSPRRCRTLSPPTPPTHPSPQTT